MFLNFGVFKGFFSVIIEDKIFVSISSSATLKITI